MDNANKNFIYNVIYQVFVFLIPLISTPYISRVLGVNNVGIYSYAYSIIYYFMLISMLGINNYGSREIAKISHDKKAMSYKFCSIYYLQLFVNIFSIIVYFIFLSFSDYQYKFILILQFPFLISCAFDINWLFFGLEDFKITISRNIIIKCLSLVLIFIFVKTSDDLWIYTLIMSISTLISQLYLWFFVKKRVNICKVSIKDIFRGLPQCLVLFIPVIAYSIYKVMDKTMIGSLSNIIELGYYESAEKIINIPICFITALGTVMMPHMSKINSEKFEINFNKSFKLCFFFLLPMIFGLFVISKPFTILFFGKEFSKTSSIIIFLLPTIFFGAITSQIRNNYLIPRSKNKVYVLSTIYGAIINLILNLIFIPKYGAYGACIGTVFAEGIISFYQLLKTRKFINFKKAFISIRTFAIQSIFISFIIYILKYVITNDMILLILQISGFVVFYCVLNYNYIVYEFFGKKKN